MNKVNGRVVRGLFGALMLVGGETAALAVDSCNTIRDPIVGVWNGESLAKGSTALPSMAVLHAGGTGVYRDITGVGGVVWKRTGVHTYQFSSTSIAEAPAKVATTPPAPAVEGSSAESSAAVPNTQLVRIYTSGTALTNANCKALTIKGTVAYYPIEDVNFKKPIDSTNTPVTFQFSRGR